LYIHYTDAEKFLPREARILVFVGTKRGKRIKARLAHVGRGKFLILDDEEGGKYVDTTVDASHIVSCLK
jgi:hypothetical protein